MSRQFINNEELTKIPQAVFLFEITTGDFDPEINAYKRNMHYF